MLMLRMYRDSFIPYHNAPGTKMVHKAYIDYCKAKSMFYMMETFLCIVVMELVEELVFWGVMLSYDLIISHSQVIDQGPSALLFFINYLTGGL